MFKCVAMLRRKEGVTSDAFVDYYETRHAPLIRRLLPGILDYRRNYVDLDGAFAFDGAAPIDFHVVTEMRFADRVAYEHFLACAAEPDVAQAIAEDEEHLFDRTATRMFVVEEKGGPVPATEDAMASLRALGDERDIARALARFARVLDTKDWGGLGEVFAADLSFDYGQGERQGMTALTDQMRRYLDVCGGTQHLLGSILIDLDGPRAVSRAYVQARHQRRGDAAGAVFDSNGEYVDRWERRPEGWRIVRRDALWATHSGDATILAASAGELG